MFESSSTSQSSRIMRTKFGKFRVIRFAIKSLTAGAIFLRKKENREIIPPLGKYYLEREKKEENPISSGVVIRTLLSPTEGEERSSLAVTLVTRNIVHDRSNRDP